MTTTPPPPPTTCGSPHRTSTVEGSGQLWARDGGLKETRRQELGHRARKAPGEGRDLCGGLTAQETTKTLQIISFCGGQKLEQPLEVAAGGGLGLGWVQRADDQGKFQGCWNWGPRGAAQPIYMLKSRRGGSNSTLM